jgi:MFS family permease
MSSNPITRLLTQNRVLQRSLFAPISAMRRVYMPLLMIYFAYGATGITGVAQQFYERQYLKMSPAVFADVAVWIMVPWTIKMVFGQFVDGVAILGSRRRVYVYLGASLVALGYLLLATSAQGMFGASARDAYYVAARILMTCGLVIQDVVADTMSTEVVPRQDADGKPRPAAEVEHDLGMVQVLGRLALMFGLLIAMLIGTQLAEHLTRSQTFYCGLVVPVISVLGAIFVKVDTEEAGEIDWRILGGGVLFGLFTVAMGLAKSRYGATVALFEYASEIVFTISLITVLALLRHTVRDADRHGTRKLALAALVIFAFRATPSVGVGAGWWQMDVLGFDESFTGHLGTISTLLAIVGMWFGSELVTSRPVGQVLAALTVIGALLSVPTIGMYYGLHEWTQAHFGFGARTIALVDTSVGSPFEQLSMIPMLTIVAVNAPAGKRATWFALMASLMNLALNAASLGTKYLNQLFPVERGHYESLGKLMITANIIGLVIPLLVIALVGKYLQANPNPSPALEPSGEPV